MMVIIIKLFLKRILKGLEKFEGVLDTYNNKSYSMRKVLSLFFATCVGFMDYYYFKYSHPNLENYSYILGLHFLMILLLLGIVSAEHIIKYKQKKDKE